MKYFAIMSFCRFLIFSTFLLGISLYQCNSTPTTSTVHRSLEVFAKDLFEEVTREENEDGRYHQNLVISPVGVWSILALLTEGAAGNTETELKNVLQLPSDAAVISRGYKSIIKALLQANSSSTLIESGNAIFTDVNRPLLQEFEYNAEVHYLATVRGIDMRNPSVAASEVNSWVSSATHDRIKHIISAGDIVDAELIVGNAVFFQGFWSLPFNSTFTVSRPFYADYKRSSSTSNRGQSRTERNEEEMVIGNVPMMHQSGNFRLAFSSELKAQILELPYEGNRLVMLVMLPRKGTSLAEVFANLKNQTIESLLQILQTQNTHKDGESEEDLDEAIDVFLPRFKVNTRIELTDPLKKMGIVDLFQASKANLSKMYRSRSYVSRVIHQAEIKVSEEGTVASAATVATINNFSMPTVFNANHPFLFIVMEKSTKAILFAGKVSNPSQS